jgi:stage II sporulation protein R
LKRLEAALLAGLILSLVITIGADFAADCAAVRGQVLRLHVLAETDSTAHQRDKLAVRDALLQETRGLFASAQGVEEAVALAEGRLPQMEAAAEQALRIRGCKADVTVALCKEEFSTREYERGTMPAGVYHSLKVTIGEGKGKNWWCVMYPPLCLPTAAAPGSAEKQVDELDDRPGYRMGFALVELWEKAARNLRKPS